MARKPRVEYAGAFYHVICRGNQRQGSFAVEFALAQRPVAPDQLLDLSKYYSVKDVD